MALLYGILRRGLVELTFDRHEREVLVRTSGLPGLRTSWRFEDVKLETERGAEDRNGQALHTLTLVNIDGRRVAIIHVPGGEAVVAARRVNEILNEPPPEYR